MRRGRVAALPHINTGGNGRRYSSVLAFPLRSFIPAVDFLTPLSPGFHSHSVEAFAPVQVGVLCSAGCCNLGLDLPSFRCLPLCGLPRPRSHPEHGFVVNRPLSNSFLVRFFRLPVALAPALAAWRCTADRRLHRSPKSYASPPTTCAPSPPVLFSCCSS